MDKQLLNILACPSCKAKLVLDETSQELICRFEKLAFPIQDGVPLLVLERSRTFSDNIDEA